MPASASNQRTRTKGVALVLLVLPLFWAFSASPPPIERHRQNPDNHAAWSALVIGPARGQIEPCGCSGGQLGGIDRISTVLGMSAPAFASTLTAPRLAAGGVVALEAASHPAWTKAQAEVLWQAFSALGFDAVGLGSSELERFGTTEDRATAKALLGRTALIASNLVETLFGSNEAGKQSTPAPLQPAWRGASLTMLSFLPLEMQGLWMVTDASSDKPQSSMQWKTLPIEATLERLQQLGLWSPADATIAFFEGNLQQAGDLARLLSKDSLVLLVGDEFEATEQITASGAQVIEIGSRLRQVLRLSGGAQLRSRDRLQQNRVFEDVPGDASVGYLRGLFRMMLQAYEVRSEVADSEPNPGHGGYAGSPSCMSCHQDVYAIWQETLHHQAWETLELDKRDGIPATFDPRCVRCHSVAYGAPGGFGSKQLSAEIRWSQQSPLANVGCESCHGPGVDHVRTRAKSDIELGGEYTCLRCHDSENDPGFHFETRWADISHSKNGL